MWASNTPHSIAGIIFTSALFSPLLFSTLSLSSFFLSLYFLFQLFVGMKISFLQVKHADIGIKSKKSPSELGFSWTPFLPHFNPSISFLFNTIGVLERENTRGRLILLCRGRKRERDREGGARVFSACLLSLSFSLTRERERQFGDIWIWASCLLYLSNFFFPSLFISS